MSETVAVTLCLGDPVRVEMTKWGDRPHWRFDARFLGADEHGDWIGIPTGTLMARTDMEFRCETDQVGLVPRADHGASGAWLATFHAPGIWVSTYVDMTSVPSWDGDVLHAVDLDLDVVRTAEGDVYVDDEDEFAEHQVTLDYPADVIALAEASCAWVQAAVLEERAPFDEASSRVWLALIRRLVADAG